MLIFIFFVQVNQSNQDWHLAATLEGEGFYGPPVMVAKSHLTTHYPLMFRPSYEGHVEVRKDNYTNLGRLLLLKSGWLGTE